MLSQHDKMVLGGRPVIALMVRKGKGAHADFAPCFVIENLPKNFCRDLTFLFAKWVVTFISVTAVK